jgi:hypothetical protein
MTLDDVRAMVLFKLLDVSIPEQFNWVAVDKNGQIGVYIKFPDADWNEHCWTSPISNGIMMFRIFIDVPDEYHWQDLVFTL